MQRFQCSYKKCSASLRDIRGVKMSLEEDIRYSSRYLIDNDVNPCGKHEIDVEKLDSKLPGIRVEEVYMTKSHPKALERAEIPPLRILSFSIICYSEKGSPKPERIPVVIISTATNEGKGKQFVAEDADDKGVIEAFTKFIQDFDPDIIAGYGSNTFEWPYLHERARRLGVKLQVDRNRGEPHTSFYGHISVTGRINMDFYELADEIHQVKIKTLENIADYFGAIKERKWISIEDVRSPSTGKTTLSVQP
ncbi:MAG: 3'-5' exonuclease [Candidatus Bathyarchaeota archaeon]